MTPVVDIYEDNANEWRWTFYAANGEEMAVSSEGYDSKSNAKRAWLTFEELTIEGNISIKERKAEDGSS